MTTISIAMATYNGARFIREQLDSLAVQTVPPIELIITDDGSTDDTLGIVEEFSRKAPFPVEVHRNPERLGYAANFMKCANLCRGDLIAFCDQDDIWDPTKLDCVSKCLQGEDKLLVFHNFRLINEKGRPIDVAQETLHYRSIDRWTVVLGLTQVFRRELLQYSDLILLSADRSAPSRPLAHDQWIYFLSYSFDSVYHLEHTLLSYRQHESNLFGFSPSQFWPSIGFFSRSIKPLIKACMGDTALVQEKRKILHAGLFGEGHSSRTRLKILEEIGQRGGQLTQKSLTKHIEYYRFKSQVMLSRAEIYERDFVIERLVSMGKSMKNSAYRFNLRCMKDAMLDFVYGICMSSTAR